MKKLILLFATLVVLMSCNKIATVKVSEGDTRVTYTKDYVVIEECTGLNGFDDPFWEQMKIVNRNQNDTIIVILNNNGKD